MKKAKINSEKFDRAVSRLKEQAMRLYAKGDKLMAKAQILEELKGNPARITPGDSQR